MFDLIVHYLLSYSFEYDMSFMEHIFETNTLKCSQGELKGVLSSDLNIKESFFFLWSRGC
jgi:hypothetical protein